MVHHFKHLTHSKEKDLVLEQLAKPSTMMNQVYFKALFLAKSDYHPVIHFREVEARVLPKRKAEGKGVDEPALKKAGATSHIDPKKHVLAPALNTTPWSGRACPKVTPSAAAGSAMPVTPARTAPRTPIWNQGECSNH